MTLSLTTEQQSQVAPHLKPGMALLGRIMREQFDGTNAETSGQWIVEFGNVPESALPELREICRRAEC